MCTPWWRRTETGPGALGIGRAARIAGFTLLEVVIAGALAATLFAVLAKVIAGAGRGYERQAVRAELFQAGRAALDRMTREIRTGGTPVIETEEIVLPFDADGDDEAESILRFARVDGRLVRQVIGGPEEVLAGNVASLVFQGDDLTVIRIGMADGDARIDLRTAVRHEN